jgi:hypothetical protein
MPFVIAFAMLVEAILPPDLCGNLSGVLSGHWRTSDDVNRVK